MERDVLRYGYDERDLGLESLFDGTGGLMRRNIDAGRIGLQLLHGMTHRRQYRKTEMLPGPPGSDAADDVGAPCQRLLRVRSGLYLVDVCVSGEVSRLKIGDASQMGESYLLAREALEYHACVAADPKIRQRRLVPLWPWRSGEEAKLTRHSFQTCRSSSGEASNSSWHLARLT